MMQLQCFRELCSSLATRRLRSERHEFLMENLATATANKWLSYRILYQSKFPLYFVLKCITDFRRSRNVLMTRIKDQKNVTECNFPFPSSFLFAFLQQTADFITKARNFLHFLQAKTEAKNKTEFAFSGFLSRKIIKKFVKVFGIRANLQFDVFFEKKNQILISLIFEVEMKNKQEQS